MDLNFYFMMGLLVLQHARPEVLQHAKKTLLTIRDFINTAFPGE
jgi:hypothetical protein